MEINVGGGAPLKKLTQISSDAVPAPAPPAPEASPPADQDLSKLPGDAPQFGTWTKQIDDLPEYDELPEIGGSLQTQRYPSDDAGDMPEIGSIGGSIGGLTQEPDIRLATERYPSDDAGDMPEIGSIGGSIGGLTQEPDIRLATERYPSDDAGEMPTIQDSPDTRLTRE